MTNEHPNPTPATVKKLYAHAHQCAYELCEKPLYRLDEQTGTKILNSRVCHINARSEGGPRWNTEQSSEDNRSEKNLILMCVEHACTIDEPASLSTYPAKKLHTWKKKQITEYERLTQGWEIDAEQADEIIRTSFSNVEVSVNATTVNLGGEGGNAPGAGGGGGGAIGPNSLAGKGGPGGNFRIDDGEYTLPPKKESSILSPVDQMSEGMGPEFKPGAGGGGAGAVGDGAIAGDGGGGGERVSALIDITELRSAGLDRVEVTVGQGGKRSSLLGQHGEDGEDTVLKFIAADGSILKEIRATGGPGGRTAASSLPDGVAELSPEDINACFRITTLMAVNAAEIRDGLLFVLGGDWNQYYVPNFPFDAIWPIVCTARWSNLEGVVRRAVFLSLIDPGGHEVSCQTLMIPVEDQQHGKLSWINTLGATFDAEGAWALQVHSGGFLLAKVDVQVFIRK